MRCITLKKGSTIGILVATLTVIPASEQTKMTGAPTTTDSFTVATTLDPLISTTTDISEAVLSSTAPAPVPITTTEKVSEPVPVSLSTVSSSTHSTAEPASEEKHQEAVGIDTMHLSHETKGNWLYKRFWWERARKLHDEILNRIKAILALRDSFSQKYTTILNTVLADFYKKSGYKQGELDAILTMLKTDLEEKKAKHATLTEQERAIFATLEKEKEQLNQLHATIQAIEAVATALDKALTLLQQQVMLCYGYEQQSAQDLNEIERELNDKQAKESYHRMRNAFENIINIESYIQGDFTRYFSTLETKAHEHITQVMETLAALKERGIDLMKQVENIHPQDCDREQLTSKEMISAPDQQGIGNWFSNMWDTIRTTTSRIISWVRSVWSSDTENIVDRSNTQE